MNDNVPGDLPLPPRLFLQELAPEDDRFTAIVDTPGFTPEGRPLLVGDRVTPGDCKRAHVKWHSG